MAVLYSLLAFLPFLFIYFLLFYYRVSLDPVILYGACGAPLARPGGRATISYPPGPRLAIAFFCLNVRTQFLPFMKLVGKQSIFCRLLLICHLHFAPIFQFVFSTLHIYPVATF